MLLRRGLLPVVGRVRPISARAAVAADPNDLDARNILAAALAESGFRDEAEKELRFALALAPDDRETLKNLDYLTRQSDA